MLKKMYHLTNEGANALHRASIWMTLFELACSCAALPVLYVLYEMLQVYTGKMEATTSAIVYIVVSVIIVAICFLL